jgi:hypothetical protein
MKIFTIAAGCLLLARLASAECVVVEPVFLPSSQRVRITALLDGKPLRDAKLVFFTTPEQQPRLSLSTDGRGVAATPRLLPGHYLVVATSPGNLHAELYLDVSKIFRGPAKPFVMDLTPAPPSMTSPAVAEKTPITEFIQEFKGLLVDPAGGPIPGAEIQVLRKGSQGEAVAKLKSDEAGRFAAPLAAGTYVAFFQMPGFRSEILGFEVVQSGLTRTLSISMQIGSGC